MIPNDLEGIVIEIDGNGTANTKRPTAERNPRVFAYMYGLARRLERDGRHGTADNYRCATAALRKFCRGNTSIRFSQLDTALMARFEDALRRQGLKRTTVSFYMSTLKAMYNKAVRDGATTDREPFKNSCTTVGTTPKRAIPLRQIRQISRMYVRTRQMALARDMFMFSLYTRGMPFVDMAYLKKSDLRNGVLTYRRKKTGQPLAVKWEQCMQDIVDSYPTGDSSFLLPIISDPTADLRRQYKTASAISTASWPRLAHACTSARNSPCTWPATHGQAWRRTWACPSASSARRWATPPSRPLRYTSRPSILP